MTKPALSEAMKTEIRTLLRSGRTVEQIADFNDVSVSTVCRYLRTLGPEVRDQLRGKDGPSPEQLRIEVLEEENRRLRAWVKRYALKITQLENQLGVYQEVRH